MFLCVHRNDIIMQTFSDTNDILEVDLLVISADAMAASLRDALLFTGYGLPHDTTSGLTAKPQVKLIQIEFFTKVNTYFIFSTQKMTV